jgi:hypothetical protein
MAIRFVIGGARRASRWSSRVLPAGSDRDEILAAVNVLASGELVATFKRPDRPSKP